MTDDLQWHDAAAVDELTHDQGKEILLAGRIVALFRDQDGIHAMDGICPHQGGPLAEGTVSAGCVTCPWHGWQYELKTGRHTISGRELAEVFPTREVNGRIEVQIAPAT